MSRPGDGERRPLVTDGAMNPDEKFNPSLASPAAIHGMTPEQARINWIADVNGLAAHRIAFVAVVEVAEGKYRRRPYLTLAGAQNAVERAEARGVDARIMLCELVPVVGAP